MSEYDYDIAIIGGGHNGLICAGYLARAGLSVAVFEKRDEAGGCCITGDIAPGYKNSTLAYTLGSFDRSIVHDLNLEQNGLKLIRQTAGAVSLLPEGRYLAIGASPKETHAEIAKFSERDADAHLAFRQEVDDCAHILRQYMRRRPPNFGGGLGEIWDFLKASRTFRKLTVSQKEKLMNIMTMSLGDYLGLWFDSDAVKGFYTAFGLIGNFVHPYAAGSAFSLIQHTSDMNGTSFQVEGGMGGLTQALVKSCESLGVKIETGAEVREILTDHDDNAPASSGIKLEDGSFVRVKKVIGNCTPYILYNDLLPEQDLPPGFLKRMRNYKYSSGTLKINVALKDLPQFTALASVADKNKFLNRPIQICPSLDYAERAFHDGRIRGFARKPVISMVISSLVDKTLAPDNHHVVDIICQHYRFNLPDEMDWSTIADEAAEDVFEQLESYAPGFRNLIVAHKTITPLAMEQSYSLTHGDIYHGAMQLNQMLSFRPAAKFADYRTPVKNLYLCGAGAHPGGGVTGLPGKLCAAEVLKDSSG